MAKKSKNSTRKINPVRTKKKESQFLASVIQWSKSLLYGILGTFLFYFFNHILVFEPPGSKEYIITFSVLSGVLAFACSTKIFERYIRQITIIGIASIFIQVITTIALTYSWIKAEGIGLYLTSTIAIPIGILWYFILKKRAVSEPVSNAFINPVKNQFRQNYLWIFGILIFLICGVLIFYKLGFYDIWEDENLVINAALGFQREGLGYLSEGYSRGWLHSFLISGFFDVFGVSEYTGRLPSALFGLFFVVLCYYVFTRWYGIGLVAVLIPIVCLMNDQFLILFRYMRMYALVIPLFLLGVYVIYRTITIEKEAIFFRGKKITGINTKIVFITGSALMLLLLAHLHKLTMIILPVFFIFIALLVGTRKTKELKYFLFASIAVGLILVFLSFGLELHSLRMFRQVASLMMTKHSFYPEYYGFMLDNGLPVNSTLMLLIAGLGLLRARVSTSVKSILAISYLLVGVSLVSMIYLIASEGLDFRYIAHIVPFVVGILLYVWYQIGKLISKKVIPIWLFAFLILSALALKADYKRVYVKHPWAPSYSIVYKTLKDKYKPGDSLFANNVKTYYLDPVKLAGNLYHNVPKRKEYTLEQFKHDIRIAQRGWVMWEKHKVYHWRDEVIIYIYENFKEYHGRQMDDYGLELWYFDESRINKE